MLKYSLPLRGLSRASSSLAMTSRPVVLSLLALTIQVSLTTASFKRKNVDSLSDQEVLALQTYLRDLEDDHSAAGYQTLAAYHGEPSMCTDDAGHKIACCIHGMATFPQWHRLYVVQFEQLLHRQGNSIGVPYWDWTQPLTHLPRLVQEPIFRDSKGGLGKENAWFSGDIDIEGLKTHTARAVDDRLFERVAPGGKTHLLELVLDALEQDDYCQFEAQFEVAHNHIHYLVGGRHQYSMSTLEYTSYDPIFFLHHSNVDRIFTIWQELQKKRGKPFDHSDCSVELFRQKLHPFDRDSNPVELTKTFSTAKDGFSYVQLGYTYDDLTLNGLNIDQLHTYLEQRHGRERAFAHFTLHGLGLSANVKVKVCEHRADDEDHSDDHCEFAGDFFILGGANEMPWEFHLPYYFDISDAVTKLGKALDGEYDVQAEIYSVNGTALSSDLIPHPIASHRPRRGFTDPIPSKDKASTAAVRKDIEQLTAEEIYELRQAMSRFQNDLSVDGYQAVAEFHGLPARCPSPDAKDRYACCIHGMPTFPHWHRLFVVQVEDSLKGRGLGFGIPYWDFTRPRAAVPALAAESTYTDPHSGKAVHNPFYNAPVAFLGETTSRNPLPELTQDPAFGDHTELFDGILLAFEQTDFCDFEVQFEVIHNGPHFLVGGFTPYSLTTLHYSAFDPLFHLFHANVDRLWAIWQALQIHRGLPYKAHCANSLTNEPMKPFSFDSPLNNNEKTHSHAKPSSVYDYENAFGYTYDTLQFGGMTIEQLDHYIEERRSRDRTFVGINLHNIGVSAWVNVLISAPGGEPYDAGHIAVLGGEKEMKWNLDRVFKVEITDALKALGLSFDSEFEVHLKIKDVTGKEWPESTFSHSTIFHDAGEVHEHALDDAGDHVRSDVGVLTAEQVQNLRDAFQALEDDSSISGFSQIAAFHGQPNWCPSPDAENKFACCAHGMSIFPHWHRLLTVQAENALRSHGFKDGLPYWDWTLPLQSLPEIAEVETYVHPESKQTVSNPLHHGVVDGHVTTRNVSPKLLEQPAFGHLTPIAEQVMLAFEQTNFCDFEVQFEIAHNYIHALVGGNEPYSMASLRYTAYDPIFFLHHSNTDRIWAIWQALQKYRGLPYNTANCDIASLRKPLQPFAQTSVTNPDAVTRDHSVPFDVFDYKSSFHYQYDNLEFNGWSISQLQREIVHRHADERVFAGFMLHGIKHSALVTFDICKGDDCTKAGEFYILGDEYEMPWEYDRPYKYEITKQLHDKGLEASDRFSIKYQVLNLDGSVIGTDTFGTVIVIHDSEAGAVEKRLHAAELMATLRVRQNLENLSKGEVESLRSALKQMQDDGTFEKIAQFHGYPGLCEHNGHSGIACCLHGGPTFPHWHRLYVLQVENALLARGSAVPIPYWDWTKPIRTLPTLITDPTFFNSRTNKQEPNPFFRSHISGVNQYTTRDPRPELFNSNYLLNNVLLALEQTSFCDFEIQFEIVHNALHSWLGGRGDYSLASLDFAAFDPVFFLHHATTDRIWATWQALQYNRGLPYEKSDCSLNIMRKPMKPFDDVSKNVVDITHKYSRPVDVFDYIDHFDYRYDNFKINSWNIYQIEEVLKNQRSRDRLFAGFLLHNIGTSADVEIFICVATGKGEHNCNFSAGKFAILGGATEMPFAFDRLYKFDISDSIRKLGLRLDSAADIELQIKIQAINGSYLDPSVLRKPSLIFQPGDHSLQTSQGKSERHLVRKEVWSLSPTERRSLVLALKGLKADSSADGFQALAAFHAVPPLCPNPEAAVRYACCVHGMATFPQWHRLYTVQFEDALRRHGALVGIPYWDTVSPQSTLPMFFNDAIWHDPLFDLDFPNPWAGADIEFDHSKVVRDFQTDKLSETGDHGYDTWSYEQYLLALEQENYCDFEVQFEIAHNAIHSWVGGNLEHSMAHLHYASYDPIFMLHHSNTDRIYAMWQALQRYRGHDPNEANCALELMREPLRPFSFGAPYNLNPTTKQYSKPEDVFDYKGHFHYEYDTLEFSEMDVPRVQNLINERKEKPRVFAGFMLHGIGMSAHVSFSVCTDSGVCSKAGHFEVLGGALEMPWKFDRLYKYEITEVLKKKNLDARDPFTIKVDITALNGTVLDSHLIQEPSVIYQAGSHNYGKRELAHNRIRHDVNDLDTRDIQALQAALRDLQKDDSNQGWQALASFHGVPALCPTPEEATFACCIHGMPTFPHWHRLYTLQLELELIRHGSSVALPYWDWTRPIDELPSLFTSQTYYDTWRDEVVNNPFARGYVKEANGYTVRDVQPELFKRSKDGKHSVLFNELLLALEQRDFCDFEVQYEVVHNAIHYLVGGHQTYSLSSLHYSSYDPIFFVHHAFLDKVWAVWQELQKRRHLPYERADCAVNYMSTPMHPFDSEALNANRETREHAIPQSVFDYESLGYHFDNLEIGGLNIDMLEHAIQAQHDHARVFAGFLLHGIHTSAEVVFSVCKSERACTRAGAFFVLGGAKEMPWSFDRLYKYDITDALHDAGINLEDLFNDDMPFYLDYVVTAVNGTVLPKSSLPEPTVVFDPAAGTSEHSSSSSLAGTGVRKDINTLNEAEKENLRRSLALVKADSTFLGFQNIAAAHGYPGICQLDGKAVACCHHGMASFPHWHRLFVKYFEAALTHHGARVGVPYWDWTQSFTELPSFLTEEEDNPFHHGEIQALNRITTRAPRPQLFTDPEHGEESFFYRQILLAFEQRDYCDFEVQFEVTHNAIHSWTGGSSPYGMSTLGFSAYDPLFYIHHSNVDRQFAIWQALQQYRGLDYNTANCNIQELRKTLEPFDRKALYLPLVNDNAHAIDAFDYDKFNYQYDNLNFHGLTISQLEDLLNTRRAQDRIFANFFLRGFYASADVEFDLCDEEDHCNFAGTFAVLGGPLEMPWSFDRLFKYDVTSVFRQMRLRTDSVYHFNVRITGINGTRFDSSLIPPPSVSFVPGIRGKAAHDDDPEPSRSNDVVRQDVFALSMEDVSNLRNAMHKLENDHGPNGFEAIASFHGAPGLCPENATARYSCCMHGMPIFPHWHRLLTVQFEMALRDHGAKVGIPYWDWTRPSKTPPLLFTETQDNPFFNYHMTFNDKTIQRDLQIELFQGVKISGKDSIYYQALETLEETNYCDFEVQFEILHNAIHYLVGGKGKYSMSTLEYSAFDPFFMVHHSSIDRIWKIWQELQKLRQKPYTTAYCARKFFQKPIEPFSYESVNPNALTRENSIPFKSFESNRFHYHYDKLDLNGHSVAELNEIIENLKSGDRIFAGFVLSGFGTSAVVNVVVVGGSGEVNAGNFYVLGGPSEMPWAYERLYRFDITDAARTLGLGPYSNFNFRVTITNYDGTPLEGVTLPDPLIVYRAARASSDVVIFQLAPDKRIPSKVVLRPGTKVRFHPLLEVASTAHLLSELGSYTNYARCIIPPGDANTYDMDVNISLEGGDYYFAARNKERCLAGRRVQITVDKDD